MKWTALIAALALAGCAKEPPIVVTVAAEPERIAVPAECMTPDKYWADIPDRDVKRSEGARNYDTNRRAFNALRGNRSVCRAGLKAYTEPKKG